MKNKVRTELSEECRSYRTAINKCMVTMLIFYGLFTLLIEVVYRNVGGLLNSVLPPVAGEIATDALYGSIYIISFVIPAILFKYVFPKHKAIPLEAAPIIPRGGIRMVLATTGIMFSTALVSHLIMMLISMITHVTVEYPETELTGAHSAVSIFILSALIPAFVEELLFRGVFLRNLLPYGKTSAIIISSLAFALMHQNFYQFFYTFVGGMALGFLFVKTGSIWCSVLAHMINNALSVLIEVSGAFFNDDALLKLQYALYSVVIVIALVCFASLIAEERKNKELRSGSVFGSTERIRMPSGTVRISDAEAVKNFFTPATIAVIIWAAIEGIAVIINWGVQI